MMILFTKRMIVHISQSERTSLSYECPICDGEFEGAESLKYHIETYHMQNVKNPSTQCGKSFHAKDSLNKHIETHKEPSIHFKCQPCNKGFHDEMNLIEHMNNKLSS